MKRDIAIVASVLIVLNSAAAQLSAQGAPPPPPTEIGADRLALRNIPAAGDAKLVVTSPAFAPGGDIPFENTQYKGNVFPGLSWTAGPTGTKSYAIIMQDPDAISREMPILHWTIVDIPASITKLDAGMTTPPDGARNGPNIRGPNMAYMGPRTPGGPKHRYHFQVFALDVVLPAETTGTYASMIEAMKGHVLASGEVIGLGQFMQPAAPQ